MRLPKRDERGFTVVELLIAVVIEAFLVAGLGTALITTMKGATSVNQSFDRSTDARTAAAYIVSDAQNSSGPELALATSTCTDAHPPVAGTATPIVEFASTSTSSTGVDTAHLVDYILVGNSLLRRECQGASKVSVSDRVVASNVGSVTASCSPTANCGGTPVSITVVVNEVADSSGNVYSYSLTGAFRKLGGAGAPVNTNPQSVVLLGSSPTCTGSTDTINISGAATMRVYGDAFINTANGASCNAMDLQNSGVWQAGSTNIYSGGTCVASGSSVCPTVTTVSTRVTDPYANFTAPSTSGLPVQTGCSGASGSQTASPGLYSSGFDLGGGNTCTLASGIYVVQGGFHVGNGATLKTASGGVLIYLMSGAFNIDGGGVITLTSMSSGTYSGLALWQAAADTQPITFSNGGAIIINGAIYAPKAQLNVSGNAQNPLVTALVVQTIVLSNSGGIIVGSPSSTPLSVSTASLPAGTINQAYSTTVAAAGGDGNYFWSATGLPATLSINASTGVISGTPTATSSSSVTVKLTDALGDNPVTKSFTLAIVNTPPTVTSTSPTPRGQGAVNQSVTINGSNFVNGAVASFSGTGITVNSTSWVNASKLTANITLAGNAPTGARDVLVTNPDGGTGTGSAVFTVSAAPTITSITPPTAPKSTTLNVVIKGTGFVNGAVVSFAGSNLPTVNTTTWNSSTQITVNVSLSSKAKTWDVIVTNPDGGSATDTGGFAST